MNKRALWIAFAFVIAVAAFARLYALDTLPPGIKYDTASDSLTVLNILYDGARPFFIRPMGATEPLIVYLQTIPVWIFGATTESLRLITALAGILSVAALFGATYEFTRDWRAATVASLALAGSLELLNLSRYGIRFILVTPFEAGAIYFFARGWRTGGWRAFLLGGVTLGLSAYTYLAALFVPVGMLLLWAHTFLFDRLRWRARFKPMLAFWVAAFVVALPRIAFQFLYPEVALARVSQVNLLQNPNVQQIGLANLIFARLGAYAKMFGIEWRDGTFGIPLFDPGVFALFVVGVIVCLVRWRKIEWAWAPLMLATMFMPDLLAADEPTLNKVRLVGIFIPAFFLVGAGASALIHFFKTRARTFAEIGVASVLLLSVATCFDAYFVQRIADSPKNAEYDDFNVSRIEVAEAEWINRQSDPVYLPLNEFARGPVHYLTAARAPRLRSALDANGVLVPEAQPSRAWIVLPTNLDRGRPEGRLYVHDPFAYVLITNGVAYLLPPTRADFSLVEMQLHTRQSSQAIREMSGGIAANAYAVDATNNPFRFESSASAPNAKFADGIELVGASIGAPRLEPGENASVSLYWRIANKTQTDYTIFVHVIDIHEENAAVADTIPGLTAYATYQWKPGEMIATHHQIKIPTRTRTGKYSIEVGLYDLAQNRLDRIDVADSRVIVGALKIAPRDTVTFKPGRTQVANFDARIALDGFDLAKAKAGEATSLKLYWHALGEMDRDYTMFVHLLNDRDEIVAQSDHQPQGGRYPTSIWDVGEAVRDEFELAIPGDVPSGAYRVRVGWYDGATGARLALRDSPGDFVILDSKLEVTR